MEFVVTLLVLAVVGYFIGFGYRVVYPRVKHYLSTRSTTRTERPTSDDDTVG